MEIEFRARIKDYLKELDRDIENSILSLKEYQYPKEVIHLDFEIFSDSFTDGSPIRVFFLDENNTEFFIYVNGEAEYPSPINPKILDVEYVYPLSLENDYANKIENFDPWKMATDEFIEWFADKWNSIKSEKFSLKATIGHHDSWKKYNLMKQCWVDERLEEK